MRVSGAACGSARVRADARRDEARGWQGNHRVCIAVEGGDWDRARSNARRAGKRGEWRFAESL
jgi:hypothetical protein